MTEQMAPGLDFEAMRRAIEESDYDALVASMPTTPSYAP